MRSNPRSSSSTCARSERTSRPSTTGPRTTTASRYVRSQVSSLKENPENGNVIVRYVQQTDGGKKVAEEEYDLVVLSVGLVASPSMAGLAAATGIACNRYGFAQGRPDLPLVSGKDGVFLCGAATGPKDIPETVMESSAAAALCGELLGSVRGTEVLVKEYPAEREVAGEEPRIGVFVCHCGTNIASVVDVAAVADYVGSIPGVVYAEHTIYTCSQDTQERIKEVIHEKNLNRVIVASCTPPDTRAFVPGDDARGGAEQVPV